MKVILGSGLTGLLARDILGPRWSIIPIGKSRHYSFNPPLADNYVINDPAIEVYMKDFMLPVPLIHRIGYSAAGQLMFNPTIPLPIWLSKVYGSNIPPQASAYWTQHSDNFVQGNCSDIYASLRQKYNDEIITNNEKFGKVVQITDHTIITTTLRFEYERVISTVPLPNLMEWMGLGYELPSKDLYCFHLQTEELNFEGATHIFVADHELEFFKATMLNKTNYIFYMNKPIDRPAEAFMKSMKEFELVAQTMIPQDIACGPIPRISEIDEADIKCIGKSATWDDCLDIGSSIKRLLKEPQ